MRKKSATAATIWSGIAPSLFVIAAMIALLLVPILMDRRVDALRADVEEVAEPARALVTELHYLLARETVELRNFLISGDSVYLQRYDELSARELALYPELERYAVALAPQLMAEIVELRSLSEQRRERATSAPFTGEGSGTAALIASDLSIQILDAARSVEVVLRQTTFARRQQIRGVEQLGRLIYLLLLGLTFAATVAIGTLNVRIRRLVAETNARRSQAEAALERTERMTEARYDLIRGFTHDVKNPLGAADGYAQLLEAGVRGELTREQSDTIVAIRRSIRGAIRIIEELLDLSRLESGGLQIQRERVDCRELADEVVRHHAGAADAAGIELSLAPGRQGEEPVVFSDPDRIRQILDNLVTNALKYTPSPGRVVVSVQTHPTETPPRPGRWITLGVSDTGPGIPAEELDRIFHEFHRVPGSPGKGHGLGLAISRSVARLLNGDVTVRSTLGEGATFLLWLPLREGKEDENS